MNISLYPFVFFLLVISQVTYASSSVNAQEFGGPTTVAGQLQEDEEASGRFAGLNHLTDSLNAKKNEFKNETGLQLGGDVNTLAQRSNESLTGEDLAWGAAARIFGRWAVVNKNQPGTGFFNFKVEYRTAVAGYVAPQHFSSELGYLGLTDLVYGDHKGIVTDFNYQQRLGKDDRAALVIGRFDPNAYQDVLAYSNPWTGFTNGNIAVNFSIALPDYSWGVAGGTWLGEKSQWYVSGNINDANGTTGNDAFFEDGAEFYKSLELGWSPNPARRYHSNAHAMVWHVDERETKGIPSSHGIAFSASETFLEDTWMVFGRLGFSEGLAPFFNTSATAGFSHKMGSTDDRVAFALQWGDPSDNSLNNQLTTETLYRFQVANSIQLTPTIQYIFNPAKNPNVDRLAIFNLRLRVAL